MTSLLALSVLAACEPLDSSGSIFAPVQPEAAAPAPAPAPGAAAPAPEAAGGFDFDADARTDESPTDGSDLDPGALATGLGLGTASEAPAEPTLLQVSAAAPTAPAAPAAAHPSAWTPSASLDGSWGVRLVATVPGTQPPRAILGLADGSEVVVEPGTLLPDAHLVVLAVGHDAVQVAEIIPKGDHVRVETNVLEPLFAKPPFDD